MNFFAIKKKTKPSRAYLSSYIFKWFICLVFIPVIITWIITFSLASRIIYTNARTQTYSLSQQAHERVSRKLDTLIKGLDNISSNTTILYELYTLQNGRNQNFSSFNIISSIRNVIGTEPDIDSVEICAKSSARFNYGDAITKGAVGDSPLIVETRKSDGIAWNVQRKELGHLEEEYVILSKTMRYDNYSNAEAGYALMAVPRDHLDKLCMWRDDVNGLRVFITTKNGTIISHPNRERIGDTFAFSPENSDSDTVIAEIDGVKSFLSYCLIEVNGWYLFASVPYHSFVSNMLFIAAVTFLVVVVCMIICVTLARRITSSISTPVNALMESMDRVGHGDFAELDVSSDQMNQYFEFSVLARRFNDMQIQLVAYIDEIAQYKAKESELMFLKTEAELNLLQQQINPHFLYNILESIFWMAYEKGEIEISEIITALGNFFRTSINRGLEYIPVEVEIANVKNYLYLHKIRKNDMFTMDWRIDPQILNIPVIKFILQPIVENAIVHGIEKSPRKGIIMIKGYLREGNLCFEVSDNGVGMSCDELLALQKYMDDSEQVRNRIGVKNVHQRLRLYYGDTYGVELSSEWNVGTRVSLKMPVEALPVK